MSSLLCFLLFLIFLPSLFQTSFVCSTSSPQLCHHDEMYALMQLKQEHYDVDRPMDDLHYWVFPNYILDSAVMSWNSTTDCCDWKGITCDGTTGHVVGLDLTLSSLYGSIHSSSTLFHLGHLQMLNLSFNDFDYFAPSGFGRLSRLMHLNLAGNLLSGSIPSEISQLTNLVSLFLSYNDFYGQIPSEISGLTELVFLNVVGQRTSDDGIYLCVSQLQIPNLRAFVQNLSNLRELRLDGVNLSGPNNRDWCRHLSSALPNLQVLSMQNCSLTGPMDASISTLRFLSELYLGYNSDLSSTIPTSLVNLTYLSVFHLYDCGGFYGDFPSDVFFLPSLTLISLSGNPLLSVNLPEFSQVNSSALQYLGASRTKFQGGKFPSSVLNLKFLKGLALQGCNFSGPIPPSLANLTYLTKLDLARNLLEGPIHSSLFFLPSLDYLDLSDNQFSEVIHDPIQFFSFFSQRHFSHFDLSRNYLKGEDLVRSISKIKGTFEKLYLSFNDFGDMVKDTNLLKNDDDYFFNAQIQVLWMNSCNLSKFPDFLRNQQELITLDLADNRIDGAIPNWLWQLQNLAQLYLSNNSLTGIELPLPNHSLRLLALELRSNKMQDCFPTDRCFLQPHNQSNSEFVSPILGNLSSLFSEFTRVFSISNNNLTGRIPVSICNARNLDMLDLANNQLSGTIPTCLGSSNLEILMLESNRLHGPIPPTFRNGCILHTINLNKNMLHGKVPRSLRNCKKLKVLNIGNNQLNDTFPYWLENLSQLQVLAMRSNKFGGPVGQISYVDSPFPNLHVFDISFNSFTGNIPVQYILNWKAMMTDVNNSKLSYIMFNNSNGFHYLDSIDIVDKGIYLEMQSILTVFTIVDLSNNKFNGEIPDAIGNLKSLVLLNLSGNSLTSQIPFSLENLSNLEALDLSRNHLSGQIPNQLTSLTFLSVLNLSDNNLTGNIPQGNQFDTFLNTSYEGNPGLCGSPLSRKCENAISTLQQEEDSTSLLDWRFAIAGYCSGVIVGMVIGQQLFWRNNRCFTIHSRIKGSKQRKGRKRKQFTGK